MKQELIKFYEALNNLHLQLLQHLQRGDVDKKFEELNEIIKNFEEDIKKIGVSDVANKKDLKKLFDKTLKDLKTFPQDMSNSFKKLLEDEKFRNELNGYFIAIVFGKVKAGKSSLGNFRLENQKVEIFKYDEAGKEVPVKKLEEINEDGFKVKATECTTEIQGFKLGGMVWIDTPGIGSMTKENEKLAKDYIKSADFIIYPTNSASPLQRDELEELKKVFSQNKKISICITKSDVIEEDECECGSEEGCEKCNEGIIKKLMNKPEEDRKAQEEWVKGEVVKVLKELNKEDALLGDVFSISVFTAKEGLKNNDEELFKGSNIEKFYALMRDIVENKAIELKNSTPYENLSAVVDRFLGNLEISDTKKEETKNSSKESEINIKKLKENIGKIKKDIKSKLKKFEKMKKDIDMDINNIIDEIVTEKTLNLTKSNSKEIFESIDNEVKKKLEEKIQKNFKKIFEDFSANINLTLNSDNFKIEDRYETIRVRYDNSSFLTNVLHTVTFGLWEKDYKTVKESIPIGDNKEEVIKAFKANRLEEFKKFAKANYEKLENEFFKPLEKELQKIAQKVESFENELKDFQSTLKA